VDSGWRAHRVLPGATAPACEVATESPAIDSVDLMRLEIHQFLSLTRKHHHMLKGIENKCSISQGYFASYSGGQSTTAMNRSKDETYIHCFYLHKELIVDTAIDALQNLIGPIFIAYIAIVDKLQSEPANDHYLYEQSSEMYINLVRETLLICDLAIVSFASLIDTSARVFVEEVRSKFVKSTELLRLIMLLLDGGTQKDPLSVYSSCGDASGGAGYLTGRGALNSPISCYNDHGTIAALFHSNTWLLDFDLDALFSCLCVTLPSYIAQNLMCVFRRCIHFLIPMESNSLTYIDDQVFEPVSRIGHVNVEGTREEKCDLFFPQVNTAIIVFDIIAWPDRGRCAAASCLVDFRR
jgi:hypothetical protein